MPPQEVEARFLEGLAAAAAGRHELALEAFGALPPSVVTPRIKLERARSLFLLERWREALTLFREVYDAPGTPQNVKRNLRPYMEAAEQRILLLRYGARFVTDSNPSKVGEGGPIFIGGGWLDYAPPAEKKTVYGVEPWISVEKLWANDLLTKLYGAASLFEAEELLSGRLDLTVGRRLRSLPGLTLQAGVMGELTKDGHYFLPSVEAWRRVPISETARIGIGGQLGYLQAKDEEASGLYSRAYVMGDWSFAENATLFGEVSAERRDSRNDFHAYLAPRLDLGVDFEAGAWNLTPRFSATLTSYKGEHGLIGAPREDLTWRPMLTLSHDRVEWRGLSPELTIFYEKRESNVDIAAYDQFGAYFSLKRLY